LVTNLALISFSNDGWLEDIKPTKSSEL